MWYILVSKINDGHNVFESLYFLAELCRVVLVLENNDCFMIQSSGRMQLYIPYMLRCRRVRKIIHVTHHDYHHLEGQCALYYQSSWW